MKSNRIVVDLNKISYAWFGYENQFGNRVPTKPPMPTSRGQQFNPQEKAFMSGEMTMIEFAQKQGLIDVWTPYATFQIMANHRLTFTGDKAVSLWKAYCEKQFNKHKQPTKRKR